MEQKQKKFNIRDFFKNQGLYVALALCLLVVGAAVLMLALPTEDDQAAQNDPPITVQTRNSDDEPFSSIVQSPTKAPMTVAPTQLPTLTPTPVASPTPTPATKSTSSTSKASAPVSGEIIWGYALDKLIYSKTLDQWMTHDAVDIAAQEGTSVKAVLSGVIKQVYEDDALGYTVVVEHTSGRTTLYANLSGSIPVKVGDRVNAGTVIGSVGTSAISECALEPHLHFAFYVDGEAVDPAKYVKLG
ncbi:MAG: peptidoglycan DD-metalloendopeptidase family protein [Eubacteriales bacterium]|nr:peptidoglycan DD-metalloendopeptidase family protein [Eubacteriales bacterium]